MYRKAEKYIAFFVLLLWAVGAAAVPVQAAEEQMAAARVWIDGSKLTASQKINVQVSVTVNGLDLNENRLALSYHIYKPDGTLLVYEGTRIPLEQWADGNIYNVPVEINLGVLADVSLEKHVDVVFDIVNESGGYWFSTSPGVELSADTVQYRGDIMMKLKESAIKAIHRPLALAANSVLWIGVAYISVIKRTSN